VRNNRFCVWIGFQDGFESSLKKKIQILKKKLLRGLHATYFFFAQKIALQENLSPLLEWFVFENFYFFWKVKRILQVALDLDFKNSTTKKCYIFFNILSQLMPLPSYSIEPSLFVFFLLVFFFFDIYPRQKFNIL